MDFAPDAAALVTLFVTAFGAATVLPFQSEIVFVALQARGVDPLALVVVASVGNTLGSLATYGMGRGLEHFRHRRWFPITERQLARAQDWFARWGVWSLLLTWAPLGDTIALASGVMRTRIWVFLVLVGIAKTLRYVVVALVTAGVL
ncbi:MAG: YqaA family protein [Shimia sp.]